MKKFFKILLSRRLLLIITLIAAIVFTFVAYELSILPLKYFIPLIIVIFLMTFLLYRLSRDKNDSHPVKVAVMKLINIILAIVLAAAAGVFIYIKAALGQMARVELPQTNPELGITSEAAARAENSQVTNIALFGVDSRNDDDVGRSDALMILSIDRKHGKIKLTSIARDTYVSVDGYGQTKINHAYAYGGPELAIKTINENFSLDVKDFVTVNFSQLAEIIDYVGGVTINVTEEERVVANKYVDNLNKLGIPTDYITETGDIRLTGGQAVAYARNRETGSDTARTSRQREILSAMFDEVKKLNITQYPGLVSMILSESKTSLSDESILEIGTWAVASGASMVQESLPNDQCGASGQMIDGVWYFVYDLNNAANILHQFIYEEE